MAPVPVFEFGNGHNVVLLASPLVPANVWDDIMLQEIGTRAKAEFERPHGSGLSPFEHPVDLLPRTTDSAFEKFLKRTALYRFIFNWFRTAEAYTYAILTRKSEYSGGEAPRRDVYHITSLNKKAREAFGTLECQLFILEMLGRHYSKDITDDERLILGFEVPHFYGAMMKLDDWMKDVSGPTDWVKYCKIILQVWDLLEPTAAKVKAAQDSNEPRTVLISPMDQLKRPTIIDISATGEEEKMLEKYRAFVTGPVGFDPIERMHDPFFKGHDLDVVPNAEFKVKNKMHVGKRGGWQVKEKAKLDRENGWGNRGHGHQGSHFREAVWRAKKDAGGTS